MSSVVPTRPQIAFGHPAARLYSRTRRNLQPRADRLVAVAGRWQHELLLAAGVAPVVSLSCDDRTDLAVAVAATAESAHTVSQRTLRQLHPGLEAPALLSVVRLPTWHSHDGLIREARLVLVADGIEYAGNLGTLVRTADAAGADAVLLTNATARPTNAKVFEASRGTVLTMPVLEYAAVADARCDLGAAGFTTYVADPGATLGYRDVGYTGRVAIVVGSESNGVSPEWRTADLTRVSIPMRGTADSLNVAASASVLLYDAVARMRAGTAG